MEDEACDSSQPVIRDGDKSEKLESDETFDNPCQPCLFEDKHVESRKFCVECREFLCEACIQFHKKVTVTKKHQLTNTDQVDKDSEVHKKREPKTLPVCSVHGGKPVNWFCDDHKKLVCESCASIDHASCEAILSIDNAAKNANQSNDFKSIAEELKDIFSKFEGHIATREDEMKRVSAEAKEALTSLEKSKANLIAIINKLSLFDEKKIKEKLQSFSTFVTNDIKQCKAVVAVLRGAQDTLDNIGDDEIHTFTQMNLIKENIDNGKNVLSTKTQKFKAKMIVYKTSDKVADSLKPFKRLGDLENKNREYVKSPTLNDKKGDISVHCPFHEQDSYDITSICILEDDFMLVTDWPHSSLKLVSVSQKSAKRFLKFEHSPFDVCKLPNKCAAVTLFNGHTVKLVSYSYSDFPPTLQVKGEFDTVEKCKGIAYFDDLLYVASGRGGMENEGPGHIRVYSVEGKLKKTIVTSSAGDVLMKNPWKIAVSFTNELYVTDSTNGLLKIKGNYVKRTEQKTCCDNIAFDEHGHIFGSFRFLNSIQQLEAEGAVVADLLTEEDGLKNPQAIAFDCKKNILYVAMREASVIKTYSLDFE